MRLLDSEPIGLQARYVISENLLVGSCTMFIPVCPDLQKQRCSTHVGLLTIKTVGNGEQFVPHPSFVEVKEFIRSGVFGDYDYSELLGSLEGNEGYGQADYFLVGHDFPAYVQCQEEVDKAYKNQEVSIRALVE